MSSFVTSPRARMVALAVGAAVIGPLAMAAPSLASTKPPVPAGQPLAGANCQNDGKISGRGSTLQLWLQYDLTASYAQNVCGSTGADALTYNVNGNGTQAAANDPTDPGNPAQQTLAPNAQDEMIAYNDYSAQSNGGATGSSNGKTVLSCRTDAFGGTDIPYAMADWNAINGAPNAEVAVSGKACYPNAYVAPFQQYIGGNDNADAQGSAGNGVMSFPIGGSAVEIAVNLTRAECTVGSGAIGPLHFTAGDIANLLGGNYLTWGQLDANNGALGNDLNENPSLAGCTEPITRVVRNDTSGTTQATLNYINDASPNSALCGAVSTTGITTWAGMQQAAVTQSQNDIWPGENGTEGHPAAGSIFPNVQAAAGACNAITAGSGSGGPLLLQALHNTAGGVGYADVSDVLNDASTNSGNGQYLATLVVASLANAATGAFTPPVSGSASNCSFSGAKLPGSGPSDYVGLAGDWALDNSLNTDDVAYTVQGSSYPACTLTWDFVWGSQDNNAGNPNGPDPEPELNADQIRTLYSYYTYVLSDPAQATEKGAGYAPLPEFMIQSLRGAFQTYF
ncbi:MAG: hypothetical protein ACLP01_18300 [Solirubrobacteraceae bacterium]